MYVFVLLFGRKTTAILILSSNKNQHQGQDKILVQQKKGSKSRTSRTRQTTKKCSRMFVQGVGVTQPWRGTRRVLPAYFVSFATSCTSTASMLLACQHPQHIFSMAMSTTIIAHRYRVNIHSLAISTTC